MKSVYGDRLDIILKQEDYILSQADDFNHDIFEAREAKKWDIVISNPPYFKMKNNSKTNDSLTKTISRHELKLTFEELAYCSSQLLKQKGHFYFIHRTDRLIEILETLREFKLEPKRIRFIHSDNNNSSLFLLDSVYYGREGLKVETPIFLERE